MSTSLAVKPSNTGRTMIQFPQARDIFDDFEALGNAIAQRAFGFFQQRGYADGRDLDDWFRAESELLKPMPIEISESDDSYTIRAEVPGFDVKDLSVRAEGNSIYIHGKTEQTKEEKKGKEVKYSEVSAAELSRRVDLPSPINPDKISAQLAKGVLELNLPKAAPPKKIEVKAA
ncbi:MAG TPA: Hsp20/alpha crystallin family protein [Acidobacteriaceae bacterium]|nr:Hsp20/alpha crystallin family protein [Acidobacteriaceae bacterium]